MQANPMADWQNLTRLYGEMGDEELYELEAGRSDLTEMAQQVLSDEMKKRGLNAAARAASIAAERRAASQCECGDGATNCEDDAEAGDTPHEFTWKTLLCECEEKEVAWQIQEVLRRAGIESWYEGPRSQYSNDMRTPSVLVAADQHEQAQEIASRPIPQEIVEMFTAEVPEYELPVCPACGAADPVLESADPVNGWLCESCGKQWAEVGEDA